MINFTQLFVCNQTQIQQIQDNQKKYLTTAKLSVLIDPEGELLLIMDDICYGITKETNAEYSLYENNNGEFVILTLRNKLHGNYELLLKENVDLFIACLTDRCQVFGKEKQVNKEEKFANEFSPQNKPQEPKELQIGLPLQPSDNRYVQMSKSLGQRIYMVGKFVSQGFSTVGNFVAKNVQPSQEVKFSQNTKKSLKQINKFTGKVFDLASGAAKKLVNFGRQVAINATKQDQSSQNYSQQKIIKDLKGGVITGLKVFINLYDGVVEAGDEVKDGALRAGGEILKKKYGVQAQQTLRDVAGGVNNVLKVYKLPKTSVKQLFLVQKQGKKD